MRELIETIARWEAERVGAGRAVVVRTFGPAPRPAGAVLLAADDGRIDGSVSGGCVESAAIEEIARARRTGRSRVIRYGITDEQAWDVGLACGGTIDVLIEPTIRPEVIRAARDVSRPTASGRAIAIPFPQGSPGPHAGPHVPSDGDPPAPAIVIEDSVVTGTLGGADRDAALVAAARECVASGTSRTVEIAERPVFVEVFVTRPRLVIVGAGQIAMSLVEIARTVGFETVVVDGRPAFATRERFPNADEIVLGWPDAVAEKIGLGPNDAVAVLSHDAKFDEPAIATALRRGCRYVGAVGSRKTQSDRRARLVAGGLGGPDLSRLRGPIGLDLGGRSPAETALAILAEVVAERHGGTARPLSGADG